MQAKTVFHLNARLHFLLHLICMSCLDPILLFQRSSALLIFLSHLLISGSTPAPHYPESATQYIYLPKHQPSYGSLIMCSISFRVQLSSSFFMTAYTLFLTCLFHLDCLCAAFKSKPSMSALAQLWHGA